MLSALDPQHSIPVAPVIWALAVVLRFLCPKALETSEPIDPITFLHESHTVKISEPHAGSALSEGKKDHNPSPLPLLFAKT